MPKLVFQNGECDGRVCDLEDGRIAVGRGEHNQIILTDLTVSRTHCELLVYSPEVIVRDLGSMNGTLVHGHLLNGTQCQALSGQIIQLGLTMARLELEPPRPAGRATTALIEFRDYMKALSERSKAKRLVEPFLPLHALSPECAARQTSQLARPEPPVGSAPTQFVRREPAAPVRRKHWMVWLWIASGLALWWAVLAWVF